jgi:hypothetical protein
MNTNTNKLALRRQSIRALNADELRMAHGGDGGNVIDRTRRAWPRRMGRIKVSGQHRNRFRCRADR